MNINNGGGAGGGGSGSNASVGSSNGTTTAPTSATEIGYVDGSGYLQPVAPGTPLPVNPVDLPPGASTSALQSNTISSGNSSTATLTANSVFTGTWEDASQYAEIRVSINSDQASATNGLQMEYSSNGSTVDAQDTYTYAGGSSGAQFGAAPGFQYFRVVYTNGSTNQSLMHLQVTYHRTRTKPSSQRQADGYTNETDLEQVWGFNSVYNGTTWDRLKGDSTNGAYVQLKTAVPTGTNIVGKVGIDQTTPGTTNGVQVNAALPAGTNLLGKVGIDQTTPGTTNAVADTTGLNIQGTVAAGTAATKSALAGQVYNSTVPTVTSGQQIAMQSDPYGNHLVISPDLYVTGQSAQTSLVNNIIPATAGSTATDALGYHSGTVQLICPAGTYTTGAVTFEGSNDNVNFATIPVYNQIILTGTPITAAITLATTTSIVYTFPIQTRYIRCRISTAITGASAQVQAFTKLSVASWSPTVMQAAQATAANLAVTATVASGTITAVTTANITPFKGTITDGSGTTSATPSTATTAAAVNASRKYLFIQNCSSSATVWINFTTTAVASQPSIPLLPYAAYVQETGFVSTELVSIISTSASVPYVLKQS